MGPEAQGEVSISSDSDIVYVRKTVRTVADGLKFGITDVTRIVTAASELARNIHLYAGSGTMRWRIIEGAKGTGLELAFIDQGPGMNNVEQALQEGYTTGRGLGMGLPGTRRLMDEMEIISEPGRGTTVTVKKWRRSR